MAEEDKQLLLCLTKIIANTRYYSSESDSSSDEEWELLCLASSAEIKQIPTSNNNKRKKATNSTGNAKRRRTIILRNSDDDFALTAYDFTDIEFKSHFRISRDTFDYIVDRINSDLQKKLQGSETVPSRKQLMIALSKIISPESYQSICDRYNIGKSTGFTCLRRVNGALFKSASQFIVWPSADYAHEVMMAFETESGFPGVIGAIGSCHIPVEVSTDIARDYLTQNKRHSIHLQIVCDHRSIITHCSAGHPGSFNNESVMRSSEVSSYLFDTTKFPNDSHLVGDSSYSLHPNVMVPFDGDLTAEQKNFNTQLEVARRSVDMCFAKLMGRMSSLMSSLPIKKVENVPEYVVACCVIHNICLMQNDEYSHVPSFSSTENYKNVEACVATNKAGIEKRNAIMNKLALRDGITTP